MSSPFAFERLASLRLNIIHLVAGAARLQSRSRKRSVEMHLKGVSTERRPL